MNERSRIIVQSLEQASLHAGLSFCIGAFAYGEAGLTPSARYKQSPLDFSSMKKAFGIIVRAAGLTQMDLHAYVSQLLATKTPLVILDEIGLPPHFHTAVARINVGLCGTAGHELGLYLNECGKKHAMFISINHSQPWSRSRLSSLRRAFKGTISEYVDTREPAGDENDTEWVVEEFEEMIEKMQESNRHSAGFIRAVSSVRGSIRKQAESDRRQDRALALLQSAAQLEADAWVIADADTASRAREFLGQLPVAKRPLLVCLDDAPELQLQGITGFNHNIEALCRQAVEYCIRPASAALKKEPGFIVPRSNESESD
jgi:hypothetical protein